MKKTDESVKAGLDIRAAHDKESNTSNTAAAEPAQPVDGDDKVHEQATVNVNPDQEQDYDEIVHQLPDGVDSTENEDLDDKVHRLGTDEEQLDRR